MDADRSELQRNFSLDHPLYRLAHLHGSTWVTLRPDDQHNPSEDDPSGPWANGIVFRCAECDERVVISRA
jgi:hypothetical protein